MEKKERIGEGKKGGEAKDKREELGEKREKKKVKRERWMIKKERKNERERKRDSIIEEKKWKENGKKGEWEEIRGDKELGREIE